MRPLFLLIFSALCLQAAAETTASRIWSELKAKRDALQTFHQEFEVSRIVKTTQGNQSSKWSIVLDASKEQWREKFLGGSGNHTTIFDSKNIFVLEEGGDEYVRTKPSPKEEALQPDPYSITNLNLSKAVERERRSCGLPKVEHQCVILDIPLKPSIRNVSGGLRKMIGGSETVMLDTQTGLVLGSRTVQTFENQRGGYQSEIAYVLKRMAYGSPRDESLFRLPSNATIEVKELSRWNAARIKKQLAGKTAPDLVLTDLQGKPISLSALKGKTVLLDFWTTWCGPCRADGPALDKLYRKYSDRNLVLIGISVDEDRSIVQKFLSEHPHSYPIALTTENEMPRAYQIGVFPTYIVVDRDGNIASATEGDTGFADLRKLLKKAGLETD